MAFPKGVDLFRGETLTHWRSFHAFLAAVQRPTLAHPVVPVRHYAAKLAELSQATNPRSRKIRRKGQTQFGRGFALNPFMIAPSLTSEQALLLRYNQQAPRYTSYPPANHFNTEMKAEEIENLIRRSNQVGPRNMGFYVHVPFCPKRCLFCGCNTEIGRGLPFVKRYMEALPVELARLTALLDPSRPVTQVHFGGGTPNAVPLSYLNEIIEALNERFHFAGDAEVAIECDPNLLTPEKLEALAAMGFNRVSYGLQDFNTDVLEAVNRRFPKMHPNTLVSLSHELGFRGVNLDLIYGLPKQTVASFRDTIQQTLLANPDRISLFPYAHVPWMKSHQGSLETLGFPTSEERLIMAVESRSALKQAGYVAIGMDHFSKPDDDLAKALLAGTLHRNFQGYCPGEKAGQIYAMGASAISQLQEGYFQNARDTKDYLNLLEKDGLAIVHSYRMRPADQLVRATLNALLCQGVADFDDLLSKAAPHALPEKDWCESWLQEGRARLSPYLADGLVQWEGQRLLITSKGLPLARLIAAAFDPLLSQNQEARRYSQAV